MSSLIKTVENKKAFFSNIKNPEGDYDHLFVDDLKKIYYERAKIEIYNLKTNLSEISFVNFFFKYDENLPDKIAIIAEINLIEHGSINVSHYVEAIDFVNAVYLINLKDEYIERDSFFIKETQCALNLLYDEILAQGDNLILNEQFKKAGLLFGINGKIVGTFNSAILSCFNSDSSKTILLKDVSCRFSLDEIDVSKAVINTSNSEIVFTIGQIMSLVENDSLQDSKFNVISVDTYNSDKDIVVAYQDIDDKEDYYDLMIDIIDKLDISEIKEESKVTSSKTNILSSIFSDDEEDDF